MSHRAKISRRLSAIFPESRKPAHPFDGPTDWALLVVYVTDVGLYP